ncbi:unnamed protein product [Pedinophyceae sp. YPF-701]|nr:unnamed protein product [Pedinophyceae sp. YPF-701]
MDIESHPIEIDESGVVALPLSAAGRDGGGGERTDEQDAMLGEYLSVEVLREGESPAKRYSLRTGHLVAHIKEFVAKDLGIPMEKQVLMYQGAPMIDPLSLVDYPGFKPGATVQVTLRTCPVAPRVARPGQRFLSAQIHINVAVRRRNSAAHAVARAVADTEGDGTGRKLPATKGQVSRMTRKELVDAAKYMISQRGADPRVDAQGVVHCLLELSARAAGKTTARRRRPDQAKVVGRLADIYLEEVEEGNANVRPKDLCRVLASAWQLGQPVHPERLAAADEAVARFLARDGVAALGVANVARAVTALHGLGHTPDAALAALEACARTDPAVLAGLLPNTATGVLATFTPPRPPPHSSASTAACPYPAVYAAAELALLSDPRTFAQSRPHTVALFLSQARRLRRAPNSKVLDLAADTVERRVREFAVPDLLSCLRDLRLLSDRQYLSLANEAAAWLMERHGPSARPQRAHSAPGNATPADERERGTGPPFSEMCDAVATFAALDVDPGKLLDVAAARAAEHWRRHAQVDDPASAAQGDSQHPPSPGAVGRAAPLDAAEDQRNALELMSGFAGLRFSPGRGVLVLAESALLSGPALTPHVAAQALFAFAVLLEQSGGMVPRALLAACEDAMAQPGALQRCGTRDLARMLWAFARLGVRPRTLMDDVAKQLGKSAQAVAKGSAAPEDHSEALSRQPAALHIGSFDATGVSMLLWAFASLDYSWGYLGRPLLQVACLRLLQELPPRGPGLSPRVVSNALWAFARLGMHPGSHFIEAMSQETARQIRLFGARSIAMIVWSLASLSCPPAQPGVLDQILTGIAFQRSGLQPRSAAVIAASLGNLGIEHRPLSEMSRRMLADERVRIEPEVLAMMAYSLGKFRHEGPSAEPTARAICRRARALVDSLSARHCANVMWALARLECYDAETMQPLSDRMQQELIADMTLRPDDDDDEVAEQPPAAKPEDGTRGGGHGERDSPSGGFVAAAADSGGGDEVHDLSDAELAGWGVEGLPAALLWNDGAHPALDNADVLASDLRVASGGDASRAPGLLPAQLAASALWSMALLGHRPPRALLGAIAVALRGEDGALTPSELCMALWGLATLGFRDEDLAHAERAVRAGSHRRPLVDCLIARLEEEMRAFAGYRLTAREVAQVTWALAWFSRLASRLAVAASPLASGLPATALAGEILPVADAWLSLPTLESATMLRQVLVAETLWRTAAASAGRGGTAPPVQLGAGLRQRAHMVPDSPHPRGVRAGAAGGPMGACAPLAARLERGPASFILRRLAVGGEVLWIDQGGGVSVGDFAAQRGVALMPVTPSDLARGAGPPGLLGLAAARERILRLRGATVVLVLATAGGADGLAVGAEGWLGRPTLRVPGAGLLLVAGPGEQDVLHSCAAALDA